MQPVSAVHFYIGHFEWLIYESSKQNFLSVQFYTSIRPPLDVIDGSAELHHLCHCFWHESSRSKSWGQGVASPLPPAAISVCLPSLLLSPSLSAVSVTSLSLFSSPLVYKDVHRLSVTDNNSFNVQKWYAALMQLANMETAGGQTLNPKRVLQYLAQAGWLTNHFHD